MKDEIKFAIDSFDITRYSSKTPTSSLRKDRLNFQIQHMFKVLADLNTFQVGFRIRVMERKQSKNEVAAIETMTSFKIKGIPADHFEYIPEHLAGYLLKYRLLNHSWRFDCKIAGDCSGRSTTTAYKSNPCNFSNERIAGV